jgi:hypothetical protein
MTEESQLEQTFEQQVAEKLSETIRELTSQGWLVVDPKSARVNWLPESLRRLEPDYVAMKEGELVVIEAKSWKGGLEDLDDLAKAVTEVPNARLEVHWLGDTVQVPSAVLAEFTSKSVSQRSAEARELLQSGHLEAAALIAWSAVEGVLLRHALKLRVPLPTDTRGATLPWRLLSELDSLGYINEADLMRLTELRRQRNAAAHFMEPENPPKPADIEYCLDIVDRMLSGRYVSVDQLMDWYANQAEESGLSATDQAQARLLLAENFPGAEAADIDEAVERLAQEGER